MQRNLLPNHKGKGVAVIIICADSRKDEEERSTLLAATIPTLQKSSTFKNLFNQLELIANERRIVTEALVSIASRAGVECLTVETRANKAFQRDADEITFSDEDMEVRYLDHRRPLYLAASINQIPIKRALVDTGTSVNLIPFSTLQAAGISESKIQGCLMEVTRFRGRDEYTIGHIQL